MSLITAAANWLDSAAPNWLSVILMATVPAVAFGLPWLHARKQPGPAGKARRNAILIWAFPVLVLWLGLNALLAPAHHVAELPELGPEPVVLARNPRSVLELLIRSSVGGLGAALVLFLLGALAARMANQHAAAGKAE